MTRQHIIQLEKSALVDAALFAEEFPGETLTDGDDWDSEAWALTKKPEGLTGEELNDAWRIYRYALTTEINRLSTGSA